MTSFDFKKLSSDLLKKFSKKQRKLNENIGLIILLSDHCKKQEIILSRCFVRDQDQMNRGFECFEKEKYHFLLETKLECLQPFNTDEIAQNILSQFRKYPEIDVHNIIMSSPNLNTIDNIAPNPDQNLDDEEDTDIDETMLLMAQMGLPTEFKSSKSSSRNCNSRTKKLQDLDLIFDSISGNVMDLVSNENELIRQWITREKRQGNCVDRPYIAKFCMDLLECDIINEKNKECVRSLLTDEHLWIDYGTEVSETDLIKSFEEAICDYITAKCIKWVQDLNLSDNYKSCVNHESSKLITYLLNSLGLVYGVNGQADVASLSYELYPIIPAKSVVYSLKNEMYLLTEDYEQDDIIEEDPMNKYYFQRYRFFDKFDEGILLDEESWYSVTPAMIAEHSAMRFKSLLSHNRRPVVIDAFCGAGGNAIRLAEQGFTVLAVDIDTQKLKLLLHNATIYGVESRIVPVCHDYFDLANWIQGGQCPEDLGVLFSSSVGINISPPWGGPEYLCEEVFDLTVMDFHSIMAAAHRLSHNVACFIPRQSNCSQILAWLATEGAALLCSRLEIEQNYVNNKMKALTLYSNLLARPHDLAVI